MVRYYHLEQGGGRVSEITEGEYEFRLRKHAPITEPEHKRLMTPGHGFESPHGTCFVVEDGNVKIEQA